MLEERPLSSFLRTSDAFSSSSAEGSLRPFEEVAPEEEEEDEEEEEEDETDESDVTRLTITVGRHVSQKSSKPPFLVPILLGREKNSSATLNGAAHEEHLKHRA